MAYITYAQRREWNDYYHEYILPALRDGSMDDLLRELNTEVRARQEIIREKELARVKSSKMQSAKKQQEVAPRKKRTLNRAA
jgi:hypothetical protein